MNDIVFIDYHEKIEICISCQFAFFDFTLHFLQEETLSSPLAPACEILSPEEFSQSPISLSPPSCSFSFISSLSSATSKDQNGSLVGEVLPAEDMYLRRLCTFNSASSSEQSPHCSTNAVKLTNSSNKKFNYKKFAAIPLPGEGNTKVCYLFCVFSFQSSSLLLLGFSFKRNVQIIYVLFSAST